MIRVETFICELNALVKISVISMVSSVVVGRFFSTFGIRQVKKNFLTSLKIKVTEARAPDGESNAHKPLLANGSSGRGGRAAF